MKKSPSFLSDFLFLLGSDRRKLPRYFLLFLSVSVFDLAGIGLVGGYVAIVTNPTMVTASKGYDWFLRFGLDLSSDIQTLAIGGLLLAVFVARAVVSILINRIIFRFSNQQLVRLRVWSTDVFQHLPYSEFLLRNSAEYIQISQHFTAHFMVVLTNLLRLFSEGLVVLAIIVLLAAVNVQVLGMVIIIASLLSWIYYSVFRLRIFQAGKTANTGNQLAIKCLQEAINGLKEVRILGGESYFLNSIQKGTSQYVVANRFRQILGSSPKYLVETCIVLFVVTLISIAHLKTGDIATVFPLLGMYAVAATRLGPFVGLAISATTDLKFRQPGIIVLANDLRRYSIPDESDQTKHTVSSKVDEFQSFELRDVTYTYPKATTAALVGLSLKFSAGECIGLMGASGSGKTTLIDTILGLLVPQQGNIIYNDLSLQLGLSKWRSHVAYLPQDVFIVDDTLRANIALGESIESIDDDLINDALKQAQLTNMMEASPDGLDTTLGDRGIRFSGGQRQRVALARAFYHGRDVLVMDEATSALDLETESEIIREIENLRGRKTLIVIAHRLSTLKCCDRIYRLEQGRIVDQGSYSHMVKLYGQLSVNQVI